MVIILKPTAGEADVTDIQRRLAEFGYQSHLSRGEERTHQLMPGGRNDPVALAGEELMRGGPHRVYLRAIEAVRDLF